MNSRDSSDQDRKPLNVVELRVKCTAEEFSQLLEQARQGKRTQFEAETPDGKAFRMTVGEVIIDRKSTNEANIMDWQRREQDRDTKVPRDKDEGNSR